MYLTPTMPRINRLRFNTDFLPGQSELKNGNWVTAGELSDCAWLACRFHPTGKSPWTALKLLTNFPVMPGQDSNKGPLKVLQILGDGVFQVVEATPATIARIIRAGKGFSFPASWATRIIEVLDKGGHHLVVNSNNRWAEVVDTRGNPMRPPLWF